MWGRQGKDRQARDTSFNARFAASNGSTGGTGRQRGLPQRPPHSRSRIERPPTMPRVARPRREPAPRSNWRRRLLIWGIVLVVCAVLACVITYAVVNFFSATSASAGAATAATNFLTAISNRDYHQAYNDLAATITVQTPENAFTEQAQLDDRCYGPITHYSEVEGSATTQGNAQSYSFSITRSKLSHPYTLKLTLQQDIYGNWKVSSYGTNGDNDDLGPGQPACS